MITHEPSFWLLTIIVSNQFPRPVTGAPSYGRICCEVYEAELDEEAAVVPVPVSGKHDVDFTMKDGNLGFHGISWASMKQVFQVSILYITPLCQQSRCTGCRKKLWTAETFSHRMHAKINPLGLADVYGIRHDCWMTIPHQYQVLRWDPGCKIPWGSLIRWLYGSDFTSNGVV